MTIPRQVVKFATGETLSPSRLNRAWQRLYKDLAQSMSKRLNHFDFRLDFTGLADTSTAEEFVFRIKAPWAWQIEYLELVVFNATGVVTNVTITPSSSGAQAVSAAPAGATTKALASAVMASPIAANTEITFTLTVTASAGYTLGRCYAIVHGIGDRGNAGVAFTQVSLNDAPQFASGEAVAAAKLNTAFTAYAASSVANTNATHNLRIDVFSLRAIPATIATGDPDMRLPAAGATFNSMDVVNLGSATNNVTGKVMDGARATLVSAVANGSGSPPSKTQGTAVNVAQTNNPTLVASDNFLGISRAGAGTIPLAYVVLYSG